MVDTYIKALLYIGTVTAIGAGVFTWFVAPVGTPASLARWVRGGLYSGCALVLIGSPLQIVATVSNLLGGFDPLIGVDYLFSTRHGTATLVRLGAVGLLIATTVLPLNRTAGRWSFGLSALLLLGTFSWTSHAVAVGGTLPLLADLLHFAAAALWAGAVLYTAWLPLWNGQGPAVAAVERVSRIGLASVVLLAVSGVYTALLHVSTPEILSGSPYGRALTLKNVLVLVIVAIAAVNRWWLLPRLRQAGSSSSFLHLFRGEALLLLGVLALTGLLTTSALPHEPGVQPDPLESLRNFLPR